MRFHTAGRSARAISTQPAGKIACEEPTFDFPETWAGDKVEHTFKLRNTGEGVLEITAVRPSCGCTAAPDWTKKIEPGKDGKVDIAINSQHLRGDVTKTITVENSDPSNPRLILTMKGKIKPAIDVQPITGFSWGQILPGARTGPIAKTITMINNLYNPWKLELAKQPGLQPQQ